MQGITSHSSIPPAPVGEDELVQMRDVSVHYPIGGGLFRSSGRVIRAVDGVTLTMRKGRTLGLVGGTGSGKSTIAQLIMGMVEPTSGSMIISGQDPRRLTGTELRAHRRRVQVVLQDPYSSLDPRMRVRDIIAEPLTLGGRARDAKTVDRVMELMRLVGLPPSRADLYPHQFSGGQRQRIAIARALAPRPDIIVLDEPTSALDVSVRAQILTLLKSIQADLGVTYLVISHDLVTVAYLATTVAVMWQGRIVELGPTQTIYRAPRHPYTSLLLSSVPTEKNALFAKVQPHRLATSGSLQPGACRFSGRCELRPLLGDPARCLEEDPALVELSPGHAAACHFADETPRLGASG